MLVHQTRGRRRDLIKPVLAAMIFQELIINVQKWLPTLDTLRNFFWMPRAERISVSLIFSLRS